MLHLHFTAANAVKRPLCRWFGWLPETCTLHQAASCNRSLYLSHNSSKIPVRRLHFYAKLQRIMQALMLRKDKIHQTIVNFNLTDGFIKCRVSVVALVMFQKKKTVLNSRMNFPLTQKYISFLKLELTLATMRSRHL